MTHAGGFVRGGRPRRWLEPTHGKATPPLPLLHHPRTDRGRVCAGSSLAALGVCCPPLAPRFSSSGSQLTLARTQSSFLPPTAPEHRRQRPPAHAARAAPETRAAGAASAAAPGRSYPGVKQLSPSPFLTGWGQGKQEREKNQHRCPCSALPKYIFIFNYIINIIRVAFVVRWQNRWHGLRLQQDVN